MDGYRDDPFQRRQRHAATQRTAVTFGDDDPASQQSGWGISGVSLSAGEVERSQSKFMSQVYTWMFLGLTLTGVTAWIVGHTPSVLQVVLPLTLPLCIAQLLLVFGLSFFIRKLSSTAATAFFIVYALLTGLSFSTLFIAFQVMTIARAFLLCAAMFGAMSLYGATTRKNLSAWGSFLFMGLFGMIGAMLLNFFFQSSMVDFVVSCAGVVVFAGLTAYDTQKLRTLHLNVCQGGDAQAGVAVLRKLAIIGALELYLDFINLFLSLLRIFGRRN